MISDIHDTGVSRVSHVSWQIIRMPARVLSTKMGGCARAISAAEMMNDTVTDGFDFDDI